MRVQPLSKRSHADPPKPTQPTRLTWNSRFLAAPSHTLTAPSPPPVAKVP